MKTLGRIYFLSLVFLGIFYCQAMAAQFVLEKIDCKFDEKTKEFTLTAVVSGDPSKMQEPTLAISWERTGSKRGARHTQDRVIEHKLTRMEGKNLIFQWKANPALSDVRRGTCLLRYKDETGKQVETNTKLTDWVTVNQ